MSLTAMTDWADEAQRLLEGRDTDKADRRATRSAASCSRKIGVQQRAGLAVQCDAAGVVCVYLGCGTMAILSGAIRVGVRRLRGCL